VLVAPRNRSVALVGQRRSPVGEVSDPFAGWTEIRSGADGQPHFGPGYAGIIWWNVKTNSQQVAGLGLSSFEWIGNHYKIIGKPAKAEAEAWWKRLRNAAERLKAVRVPRPGPIDGPRAEIWALPSALQKI
jgi:hypothetical protein